MTRKLCAKHHQTTKEQGPLDVYDKLRSAHSLIHDIDIPENYPKEENAIQAIDSVLYLVEGLLVRTADGSNEWPNQEPSSLDTKTCIRGHTMTGIGFDECPECESPWKSREGREKCECPPNQMGVRKYLQGRCMICNKPKSEDEGGEKCPKCEYHAHCC